MVEQSSPPLPGSNMRAQGTESRAWVRYPCNAEISFQPLGARKDGTWRPARVMDISAKGVGLMLDSSVKPGTILSVKLEGAAQRLSRPLLMRVRRAEEQPGGGWHIGGTFALPLGDYDLRALLPSSYPLPASPGQKLQAPPRERPAQPADTHDPFVQGSVNEGRLFPRRLSDVPVILSCVSSSGGSHREKTLEALAIDASLGGLRLLLRIMAGRIGANASEHGIDQIAEVAARLEQLAGSSHPYCDEPAYLVS